MTLSPNTTVTFPSTRADRHITAALAVIVAAAGSAAAQTATIRMGRSTLVSGDAPTVPHAETFLAVNPRDARNLIAASTILQGGWRDAVYASHDGGRTWTRAPLRPSSPPTQFDGDPVVYFDERGVAVLSEISPFAGRGFTRAFRSTDGGTTWDGPVQVPGLNDRQYMAIDTTDSPYHGRVYAWAEHPLFDAEGIRHDAIDLPYSLDGGRSYLYGRTLDPSPQGRRLGAGASDVLIAPDGAVILPYRTWDNAQDTSDRRSQWWTIISRDGGKSIGKSQPGPIGRAPRQREAGGAPRAAIDLSNGDHRGRVYLTFPEEVEGVMRLQAVYSDDQGKTWADPKLIASGERLAASNLTFAVNKNGVVGAMWLDRRADSTRRCHQLYVSASVDGGDSWFPPVQAQSGKTCMHTRGNSQPILVGSFTLMQEGRAVSLVSPTSASDRFPNGGDTQGFATDAAGSFHIAWTGGETGVSQIWHTSFTVEGGPSVAAARAKSDEGSSDALLLNDLELTAANPRIDFERRTTTLEMYVTNVSRRSYKGPFTMTVTKNEAPALEAANAENGKTGEGAMWTIRVPGNGVLRPGAKSQATRVEWKYTGDKPVEELGTIRAYLTLSRKHE